MRLPAFVTLVHHATNLLLPWVATTILFAVAVKKVGVTKRWWDGLSERVRSIIIGFLLLSNVAIFVIVSAATRPY